MSITVYPTTPNFVAEIYDVDLSRPLEARELEEVKSAFWRFGVLVFPGQQLTQEQHVRFAENFGPMETTILKSAVSDKALRVKASSKVCVFLIKCSSAGRLALPS